MPKDHVIGFNYFSVPKVWASTVHCHRRYTSSHCSLATMQQPGYQPN